MERKEWEKVYNTTMNTNFFVHYIFTRTARIFQKCFSITLYVREIILKNYKLVTLTAVVVLTNL